ncbi:uncharacterized protein LOC144103633 [Amblyomma americanum]
MKSEPVMEAQLDTPSTQDARSQLALASEDGNRPLASPMMFWCDTCGALFPTKDLLRVHRSREHPPRSEERYRCAYCDYSRDSKGLVNRHERTHTGERPYVCQLCNTGFTQRWNLSRHMLRHSGEKPHQCTECGQRFSRGDLLERHRRLLHSVDGPDNVAPVSLPLDEAQQKLK